ncbi:hypothetical protein ACHAXM_000834 [Skeletonema potamos]
MVLRPKLIATITSFHSNIIGSIGAVARSLPQM